MPLENLVSVIETLKQRIQDHGGSLSQDETRTRTALIEPLLTSLGWDVADPGLVTLEYVVGGQKRADYALLNPDGDPTALIEATKLAAPLPTHRGQTLKDTDRFAAAYTGLTNGDSWEVSAPERPRFQLSLTTEPTWRCVPLLTTLWYSNLTSAQPWWPLAPSAQGAMTRETAELYPATPDPGWTPLLGFRRAGKKGPPPLGSLCRLPNGDERSLRFWYDLPVAVAEHLIAANALTASNCPVPYNQNRNFVHSQPVHPNGQPFTMRRRLSNGLFLETIRRPDFLIEGSKLLLNHCHQDPANVWLWLPNP